MTLPIGYVLLKNRYRITHLVGQGGFGAVYRAWDQSLLQTVALKENIDSSIESQRRFEREATLLAGLRHPNLPRVIDHFILPNQGQYLVMDFVEGQSLGQMLRGRGGPLGEKEAREWLRQVCQTVQYLHSQTPPIIHRDIKPDNIIITAEGRAMLVDFGISKLYEASRGTSTGSKAITPGYSPPEQYGIGKTDARSDVYALGATLYTLLTGQVPPEAVDLISGTESLLPPRQANPAISEAAERAIAAAMMPSVSQRVESVARFEQILNSRAAPPLPSAGASYSPPSTPPPTQPLPGHGRRGRWFGAAVAGLALIILGAFAWVALAMREKPPVTPTAEPTSVAGAVEITPATATITGTVEPMPLPTTSATADSPTRTGADTCEPNDRLDITCLFGDNQSQAFNFVPPFNEGPDQDFYRIWVKPGVTVTCETNQLSAVTDTNMIMLGPNGEEFNPQLGNDDKAPGDRGSRLTFTSFYMGWLHVLVGPVNPVPLAQAAQFTYTLACTSSVPPTATPTSTLLLATHSPTLTPTLPPPANPPSEGPQSKPAANPPTATLSPALPSTPTPRPTDTPTSSPTPTPTSSLTPTSEPVTYTAYVGRSDDSQALYVEIPVEWDDIDGSNWVDDDGTVLGSELIAAPNIADFAGTYTTPGVQIKASASSGDTTMDEVVGWFDFSINCTYNGRFNYAHLAYTGVYDRYLNCDGTNSAIIVLAAEPAGRNHYVIVLMQAVTFADQNALNHILNTFNVVGTLPGQ